MPLTGTDLLAETPAAEPRAEPREGDRPGDHVGVYRLLEEVGRTAVASVWLAERADGHFEREVALKVLHVPRDGAGAPPTLAWTERMLAERKLAARLAHPHLARVFDAGVDARGRPYLVTSRVLGSDLIQHAQRRNLPAPARLALMAQACSAVSHLHGLQWAHGRLKPSNLRVDDDGCVQLLDTGMSRLLAGWQQQGAAPSVALDVVALGVMLRELMAQAPGAKPLRKDIQAVMARAVAEDPVQRYPTVDALMADVHCMAESRPVAATRHDRPHAAGLWLRRHRTALGLGAALSAGLMAVTGWSWQQHQQALKLDDRDRRARAFVVEALPPAERNAQRWQAALTRARAGFEGEPALRGQVLMDLGVAGRALGQPEGALQALAEAHALLQRVTRADDPARLAAATEWASQGLLNGRPEAAATVSAWAEQALQSCRQESARCALARASAHLTLSLLAQARNDTRAQQQALERQASELATARRLAADDH
jgi:hypothetical protein